jgi:hypothetical protein
MPMDEEDEDDDHFDCHHERVGWPPHMLVTGEAEKALAMSETVLFHTQMSRNHMDFDTSTLFGTQEDPHETNVCFLSPSHDSQH